MRDVALALAADTRQLHDELDLGPLLEQALAQAGYDRLAVERLTARAKRLAYVNGVISIYGLIEETVSSIILEAARLNKEIYSKYADLPERVRKSHHEASLRALLDGARARIREPLDPGIALMYLASNYSNGPVSLNDSAFTYSTANYRHTYIVELLQRVNIDVATCATNSSVVAAMVGSGLQFRDVSTLINDLVERRNQIAHSLKASELLDTSVLKSYLRVVATYLTELVAEARRSVLLQIAQQQLLPIGLVVGRWSTALGIDMTAGEIQSPCMLLVRKLPRIEALAVDSLQSDGSPLSGRVEHLGDTIPLGVATSKVTPRWARGAEVFVLPNKWEHLGLE